MMTETKKPCTAATVQGANELTRVPENYNANAEKSKAAHTLSDEIGHLEILLQRAILVMEDLQTDYLDTVMSGQLLEYYHRSAGIRGEIVADYLYQLSDKVKELCDMECCQPAGCRS